MTSAVADPPHVRILSAAVAAPLVAGAAWIGGWVFQSLLAMVGVIVAVEGCRLIAQAHRRGDTAAAVVAVPVVFVAAVFAPVILVWLRADPHDGTGAVLWIIGTIWAADSAAYAAGKIIGGPRLAPRISPGKTWAGFVAALIAAAIAGIVAASVLKTSGGLVMISILLGLAAQGGDLAESILKRRAGVKDSGSILPGHGGLLDRVDGLLAAVLLVGVIAFLRGGESPASAVLSWP